MHNQEAYSFKKEFPIFFLILVIFGLAIHSFLFGYCVSHDDLYYFVWDSRKLTAHPQFNAFFYLYGRPLGALIYVGDGYLVNSLADGNLMRLHHIVVVGIFGFILFSWLRINNFKMIDAILISLSVITLPAFLLITFWASQVINGYALITSSISAIILAKVAFSEADKRINIKLVALSFLLIFMSPFIHQNGAMFFWVIFGIILLNKPLHYFTFGNLKKPLLLYFSVFGFAMVSYFLTYFYVLTPMGKARGLIDQLDRANVSTDIIKKLTWFFGEPLNNALNFWHILPSKTISAISMLIILFGLFYEFIYSRQQAESGGEKRENLKGFVVKFLLLILVVLLAYLPNLAAGENKSHYHTLVSIGPMLFLLLIHGVRQIVYLIPVTNKASLNSSVLGIIATIAVFNASNLSLNNQSIPCSLELGIIKSTLKEYDLSKYSKIHVIQPRQGQFLVEVHRYGAFGVPSSFWWHDVNSVVRSVLFDLGFTKEKIRRFKITYAYRDKTKPVGDDTILIDLSRMNDYR